MNTSNLVAVGFAICALAAGCSSSDSQGEAVSASANALPDPLRASTVVYLMNGDFNPSIPPEGFESTPPSAYPGLWVTDYPYSHILGWSKDQIDAEEQKAIAFFVQRFGVDPTAKDMEGKIAYSMGMADPRWNYRAYQIPGMNVPPEGYLLWDVSFDVLVMAPEGISLGGEFAGQHLGPGAALVYGHYIIQTGSENLVIGFKSHRPVVTSPSGMAVVECEIDSDRFGMGIAQAAGVFEPVGTDGTLHVAMHNTLTFSGK